MFTPKVVIIRAKPLLAGATIVAFSVISEFDMVMIQFIYLNSRDNLRIRASQMHEQVAYIGDLSRISGIYILYICHSLDHSRPCRLPVRIPVIYHERLR